MQLDVPIVTTHALFLRLYLWIHVSAGPAASSARRSRHFVPIGTLAETLDQDQPQAAAAFEDVIRSTAEKLEVKAGQLIHPSRVALTGQSRSAGIFEVMELMGGPRAVARLRAAAT